MAFLGKGKKQDMLQLAEELGINATLNMTVPSIKIAITNSEGYEEEFVKNLYETIIANGKRLKELERAEKIRLEELVKEQALKEKELQLKFDLERFKIESGFRVYDESNDSTNACSVTSNLNFKKLIPGFDPKQSDISLYLVIFERQAKRESIEKKEWMGQLLGLLLLEIVQFIAREPEEQAENYDYVKKLLLKRFKLSPEVFRQKFVQHQKKSDSTWKDFTFEITNYLDEWLIGLEINTFQDLKDLMVVDQLKKRANASMKDHFLDNWANLKSATQITELFDNYEDVRKVKQPLSPELVCLPLAVVEISGNFGTVQTKAAVCGNHLNQHGRYLLGNKTAELIKGNLGYNFLPVEILNAVQTRSQVKAAREERGIDSGDAKKGEDEVITVSSDAEDEILIPALQEYVPELAMLRVTRENLINAQKNSEEIKSLYEQAASQVQVTNQVYSLEKELLVKNREDKLGNVVKLIVVPKGLRYPIKSLCYEGTSAHLGITKSKDKLNRYFYWPNCYRDMEQFVKTCDQCQRAGKPNDKKKAPLKLVPVIQEVFTKLNIDACGPLPITSKGNRYLITAICMSSKFPEAIPVSDISSVSVTDALLNIFSRMGFPREIQGDQGTSFTSALTTEFFERFGILVRHSSVYHPQSNPVERFHRTLKRLLRVLCLDAGSEWDKHLPSILLALRTVSHESTGYTPSELVYGKNLRTPDTLVMEHWMEPEEESDLVTEYMFKLINRLKRCQEVAINKMEEMQVKRKTWYDKNAVKREFKDGDLVLVLATSRANKLAVQWIGPGTILNKISETNYLVEIPGRRETSQIYHINMLKPYYKRPEHVNASELNKHLHDKQMDRLRELLSKYSKCFSNNPGLTNLVEHEIQLVSDQPVRTKPYRMSHRQNEILKNEINRMLKLGIIEVGESDYMSPMIFVEVAGKEPRPCIDYRKLNGIIRTEYFPLPNIEERVEKVSAAKFITVLDLSKGYWQIHLSKTAQRYAAFCTSFGTYRPLRMSFGLKNAPYFFSKLMAELLNGLEDFVVPYLDDIAIFSNTWESHIKHMETVLQRIKRAKLTKKPSKCKFVQQNVKFLGHIVGQGFRTPSEIKVQAVLEFPTPRTKTQIRAFLGLAGYY
ncbi:retrovirus-related Pol polyprotein from transposon 297 [Trichonephila clavipes]|nr:retrovirus-related Pol polyprotein from transposon 297 [Trichonephila clavipes]